MNNKPFDQAICILWYRQAPPPGVCKCVQCNFSKERLKQQGIRTALLDVFIQFYLIYHSILILMMTHWKKYLVLLISYFVGM